MPRQPISLREANQNFSRLIAAVERGEVFAITRRGREVAHLTPSSSTVMEFAGKAVDAEQGLKTPTAIPLTDAALAERMCRLEVLVDKLLLALSSSAHHR